MFLIALNGLFGVSYILAGYLLVILYWPAFLFDQIISLAILYCLVFDFLDFPFVVIFQVWHWQWLLITSVPVVFD